MSISFENLCDDNAQDDLLTSFGQGVGHPVTWRLKDQEADGVFWRYVGHWFFGSDGNAQPEIYLERWVKWKDTPKGCWVISEHDPHLYLWPSGSCSPLVDEPGVRKLVLEASHKKWAYPTKAEAWQSFCIRQTHRLKHVRNQLIGVRALNDAIGQLNDKLEGEDQ